ncbi:MULTISPECIES: hypothetical protein [unclassified Pseudomonas]|uniref:hypothetical protein n=1 Tax=unclassified Pseudomonas TaxID=196821 RepID=UPI001F5AED2D|nr:MULTISPECIES: hypothetical protein [unclassified Pseudomonas]
MPSIENPDDGDTEPIALLVAMHSLTILGPTLIKIGYVMRLLAQYRIRGLQMIPQTA